MFNFKCIHCNSQIQAEYRYIGEIVVCPICSSAQIMPDPILTSGSEHHGYRIQDIVSSSLLWNTYLAKGENENAGKDVILRIPSSFFLKNVSAPDKFYDAVIKMGSMNIPEFPALLDRSLIEGKIYFVFDYLKDYKPLSEFATGCRILEFEQALIIVRKVAFALKKAWGKSRILHQNLIPENIRANDEGEICILNMGIYDFLLKDHTLLDNGFNVWDCRYMSSEFLKYGKADTPACDIYSLGGVFFMLLTGRHPFEDVEPHRIPDCPVPNPAQFYPYIPASVTLLINSMMERDLTKRISDWDVLLSAIDGILSDIKHDESSEKKHYTVQFMTETQHDPVGYAPGRFNHRKDVTEDKKPLKREYEMTDTIAKLMPQNYKIDSLSTGWQSKTAEDVTKKERNLHFVIYVTAAAFIAVVIMMLIFIQAYYQNASETASREETQPKKEVLAQSSKSETVERKSHPSQNTGEKTSQNLPLTSQVPDTKKQIVQELESVDKYFAANKDEFKTVLKKYGELMERASKIRNVDLELSIQEKIYTIEDIQTQPLNRLIADLQKKANELVASGDYEKAIGILLNYKGELEKESQPKRASLALDINKMKEEKTKADMKNKDEAVLILKKLMRENLSSIFEGDILSLKINLEKVENDPEFASVKKEIQDILGDIRLYEDSEKILLDYFGEMTGRNCSVVFRDSAAQDVRITKIQENRIFYRQEAMAPGVSDKSFTVDQLDPSDTIKILTGKPVTEEGLFLLKAIIYFNNRNFDKAKENLGEMPFDTGVSLIEMMPEYEARSLFSSILEKYNLKYNDKEPEKLMADMSKKTLTSSSAEELFLSIQDLKKKFSGTKFIERSSNIIETVESWCKRFGKSSKLLSKVELSPDRNPDISGENLRNMVEKALSGTSFHLKKGFYRLSPTKEINVGQKNLSITADYDTVIDGAVEVSGQSIEISGVRFLGRVQVSKFSKDIKIRNCYFSNTEVRAINTENVSFENCFFRSLEINNSINVSLRHCTLTNIRMSKAKTPLIISHDDTVSITDSIIYGDRYGIIFSEVGNSKKRKIYNTLCFGDAAIAALEDKDMKINEKDLVKKQGKLSRFCKVRTNVYSPAQFVNPGADNWELVPGVPGTKAASDNTDCGILWNLFKSNLPLAESENPQ